MKFFTAVPTWDHVKSKRHRNYIDALTARGVKVIESRFRKMKKHCAAMDRYCSRHEEKQTDVAIAVTLMSDAINGHFTRAVLVTADSDQVPLAIAFRDLFPHLRLTLATPPERGGEARELGQMIPDRTPITAGRLRGCLLPRDVFDAEGRKVATQPASYMWRTGQAEP